MDFSDDVGTLYFVLEYTGVLLAATIGGLIAYFAPLRGKLWENFRFYADVVTIGVWAVGGTIKGLEAELSWVPCVLLAVITATGGTLARDGVLRQIPALFTSEKMTVFPAIIASVIMLVLNRFDLVWEGMLAAAIAAPLFALAVYFGGDKLLGLQTKRIERPLEEKIGEALGVDTDSRRPAESGKEVRNALESASDEQLIQALRVMLQNEVRESTEAKT